MAVSFPLYETGSSPSPKKSSKAKLDSCDSKGKANKARALTENGEETLWEVGTLGTSSPQVLSQTAWWLLTQYFGLRGRQEHHDMTVTDFKFGRDENNTEFVEFVEGPTKTRQAGLSAKPRSLMPKMFATDDDRCPVAIFKEFLARRPPEIRGNGPLFLTCVKNPKSYAWYKKTPMGINKINNMMKSIVEGTPLQDSGKKLTNHSGRKTVFKKMKKAGYDGVTTIKVTGHRDVKSTEDYDEADEAKQRQNSNAISAATNNRSQLQTHVSKQVQFNPVQQMNNLMENKTQSFVFNNCQVTFNMAGSSPAGFVACSDK